MTNSMNYNSSTLMIVYMCICSTIKMTSPSPCTIEFPHRPQNSCVKYWNKTPKEWMDGRKEGRKGPGVSKLIHLLCEKNVELNDGDQHTRYSLRFERTWPPIKYQGLTQTTQIDKTFTSCYLPSFRGAGRAGWAGRKKARGVVGGQAGGPWT